MSTLIPYTFDKKLSVSLICGFVLATIIGLVLVILCPYITSKGFGYNAYIHYNGVHWINPDTTYNSCDTIAKYISEIKAGKPFPGKKRLTEFSKKITHDYAVISISPVLLTMLIGTIAFIFLFYEKNRLKWNNELSIGTWVIVFFALLWLLEIFLLIIWLLHCLFHNNLFYFNMWHNTADYLRVPDWLLVISTGLTGITICVITIFYLIPSRQRITFIVSGIIGSSFGIGLWFFILGPKIMP